MKKKRPKTRQDSPVLNQLAKLIDVRLPDQHGFALLTFPLGAAVDPVMRYVGKGDRDDIIASMQAWIDAQRNGAAWGHDMTPEPSQWTMNGPTEPGLYCMRLPSAGREAVDLVKLHRIEDGDLLIYHREGTDWVDRFDFVSELADQYIWLGPIPEPWKASQPAPTTEPADTVTIGGTTFRLVHDAKAANEIQIGPTAEETEANIMRVADAFRATAKVETVRIDPEKPHVCAKCGESLMDSSHRFCIDQKACHNRAPAKVETMVEILNRHHADAIDRCTGTLLKGITVEGGFVNAETLRDLVLCAFQSGVMAEHDKPLLS